MLFAGMTAVLAKLGLAHVHPDLGLGIRTAVIFLHEGISPRLVIGCSLILTGLIVLVWK
jgi:uncharacterized membrane protein